MRVHHLSCLTMCPPAGRFFNRHGKLVCHVLVVESPDGIVLVDCGVSARDCAEPRRLGLFSAMSGMRLDPETTALRQLERLGLAARDVRHIVPTHLDLDHAGGMADFPAARVHVHALEYAAAMTRPTALERFRYRPAQWQHGPRWTLYPSFGDRLWGLECVRTLDGLPPEIALIPMVGHTRGHSAVAVQSDHGWLVHCGDAYTHKDQMSEPPRLPVGLDLIERIDAIDLARVKDNQRRLRELARAHPEVRVFSAHDPDELAAFTSRSP